MSDLCLEEILPPDVLASQSIRQASALILHNRNLKAFIEKNGDKLNNPLENGWFLLLLASKLKNLEAALLLLSHGANPNACSIRDSLSPLICACYDGNVELVSLLLKWNASCVLEVNGISPLVAAAHEGHVDCATMLLNAGALVDQETSRGDTALMAAASAGQLDTVAFLVSHGAAPNYENRKGFTPLMRAVLSGKMVVCQYLLDHGAVVDYKPRRSSLNAFAIAERNSSREMYILLNRAQKKQSSSFRFLVTHRYPNALKFCAWAVTLFVFLLSIRLYSLREALRSGNH